VRAANYEVAVVRDLCDQCRAAWVNCEPSTAVVVEPRCVRMQPLVASLRIGGSEIEQGTCFRRAWSAMDLVSYLIA
jgi:hypothetical protein